MPFCPRTTGRPPRTGLELWGKGRAGEVILSGKESVGAEMLNAIHEADFLELDFLGFCYGFPPWQSRAWCLYHTFLPVALSSSTRLIE